MAKVLKGQNRKKVVELLEKYDDDDDDDVDGGDDVYRYMPYLNIGKQCACAYSRYICPCPGPPTYLSPTLRPSTASRHATAPQACPLPPHAPPSVLVQWRKRFATAASFCHSK